MKRRDQIFIAIVVVACLAGFYRVSQKYTIEPILPKEPASVAVIADPVNVEVHSRRNPLIPDFRSYRETKAKKIAFFAFMLPFVEDENQRIAVLRTTMNAMKVQTGPFTDKQLQWLAKTAKNYRLTPNVLNSSRVDVLQMIEDLSRRLDQIPPSLALAQSANESAWGTSRFAEEANNMFGQWCFRAGCGVVPRQRAIGAVHEVAKFDSPRQSVVSYMHNLNTNLAYGDLRKLRAEQRQNETLLSGTVIAEGLLHYSSRGEEYIKELQEMIRTNDLQRFDTI